jgi:hypothetical protein
VIGPELAELETILIAWTVESLLDYEGEAKSAVLEAWQTVVPDGVALGRELHRNGRLEQLKEKHASVPEVLKSIEHRK